MVKGAEELMMPVFDRAILFRTKLDDFNKTSLFEGLSILQLANRCKFTKLAKNHWLTFK